MNILKNAEYLFTISKLRKCCGEGEEEEQNGKTTIEMMLGILVQMKKIGKYGNIQHDGKLET